jgi:hypothetical protein
MTTAGPPRVRLVMSALNLIVNILRWLDEDYW